MNSEEIEVGIVEDFFAHIEVAAVKIMAEEGIKVGDKLHFKGHTTDLVQEVDSMQIEHESVQEAKVGDSVGIKTSEKVRTHDKVFKIKE